MSVQIGRLSASRVVVYGVTLLLAVFVAWAAFASIEEITRAEGKVIPSRKMQVIQSSEAGVVAEISARRGQKVSKGDILIRLDSTPTRTSLGEVEARVRALRAQIARLRIEHEGDPSRGFTCPREIAETVPEVCANEAKLMELRYQNFLKTVEVLKQRVEQRSRELSERRANRERVSNNLDLARQELKLLEPLAQRNLVSQTDFLRARREASDLEGQSQSVTEEIARIEAALREATLQVEEANLRFRQEASADLTKALAEFSIYKETARGAEDRVARTDIRSPVDGIVNELNVTTIGAFVNAGTHVADVVPIDDQLLIEGRVLPADIAFIRPGQEAVVKITSYDFSIYGGLAGVVEHVSADTIYDEVAKETFYTVVIRTEEAKLIRNGREYPIIPGMICQVDILTGKKTILQYLLKPINKARQEALRER